MLSRAAASPAICAAGRPCVSAVAARPALWRVPRGASQLVPPPLAPLGFGSSLARPGSSGADARQRSVVARSFLGVGAPEAILVAVVALVVFGPKGLADAAKSLGQTLRAFQPTIREVVEVSQEIKGTLEQELGIDEIRQAATMRPVPRPARSSSEPASSGDDQAGPSDKSGGGAPASLQPVTEALAKQLDPEIELKRAMSEQAAWGGQAPVAGSGTTAAVPAAAAAAPPAAPEQQQQPQPPQQPGAAGRDLSQLSLAELEAELARRKQA